MAELPPDAPRLRAILAFLEERIAESETVGIYLRLQRDAVQEALARAEGRAERRRSRPDESGRLSAALPSFAPGPSARQPTGFVVQRKRTPNGPEPALIHAHDCTVIEGATHPIGDHEARVALMDPAVEPCAFCRPDSELGVME